ncbi:MAG TPA: hypothetical protein VFQ43_19950 [Nitrososphaera sp.]|nr:hypothetical protein [Nitrososphaera sp.]
MIAKELKDFVNSVNIPDDAEVVSQIPTKQGEDFNTYLTAGIEYDEANHQVVINIL